MTELIEKWKEFIKWYWANEPIMEFDGVKKQAKPTFYDFMEYLSNN